MMEQIGINYWLPYIQRYLKTNNLKATRENIEAAFEHHKNTLFQETGLNLKKIPSEGDLVLFREILVGDISAPNTNTNTIYGTTVYCGLCGRRVGKVLQGAERNNIICMECAEKEDIKRNTTVAATT